MSHRPRQLVTVCVLIAAGFAVVLWITPKLERARPAMPSEYSDSDLVLQGKDLKGYLLGAEGLVADWYWIISLQYLGGKIVNSTETNLDIGDLRGLNPRLLYPYLDNATSLDPRFTSAYSFGATVLPAIDPKQAIELTKKGIENNPEHWRLYQYLGYIYWVQKDYRAAADTYDAGSKIAGAPPFMLQMAANMRTKGGDRDTARAIYQQMLNEAEDEQSRRSAQFRLTELGALDQMDAINSLLAETAAARGCPASVSEIFPRLRNLRLPPAAPDLQINQQNQLVDPGGTPYIFDRSKCEIELDQQNSKISVLR